jgi:hypothetical protein
MRFAAMAGLFLAASPAAATDEVPFEASADLFADAAACEVRLDEMVADARQETRAAVEGPYEIAPGDLRAHWVEVSGSGHRITEHRCLGEKLSGRSWRHSIVGGESDEPQTIEQMAARAEWLK